MPEEPLNRWLGGRLFPSAVLLLGIVSLLFCNAVAHGAVVLHCAFGEKEACGCGPGKQVEQVRTGQGSISEDDSPYGKSLRLRGDLKNNAVIKIPGECINFARSGRVDFWVKFNEDPHGVRREKFLLADSAWPSSLQMEIIPYEGNGLTNLAIWLGAPERGLDKQLFVSNGDGYQPGGPWSRISAGAWHRITLKWWKHNNRKGDEARLYIDGITDDHSMHDKTGKLPDQGSWGTIYMGANKYGDFGMDVSFSELWIFDDPDDSPEKHGLKMKKGKEK